MPHAIFHAIDSTPFEESTIRMSEFKGIIFLAIVGNMRKEYNELGYFGVRLKNPQLYLWLPSNVYSLRLLFFPSGIEACASCKVLSI